jgi:hypothetical protein
MKNKNVQGEFSALRPDPATSKFHAYFRHSAPTDCMQGCHQILCAGVVQDDPP